MTKNKTSERKYKYKIEKSLKKSRSGSKWLQGKRLWFPRNIDPSYNEMTKLVTTSGG